MATDMRSRKTVTATATSSAVKPWEERWVTWILVSSWGKSDVIGSSGGAAGLIGRISAFLSGRRGGRLGVPHPTNGKSGPRRGHEGPDLHHKRRGEPSAGASAGSVGGTDLDVLRYRVKSAASTSPWPAACSPARSGRACVSRGRS